MSSIYFDQIRAVDPYATYNSNAVNMYHRLVSDGRDGLKTCNSFRVTIDSTSSENVLNISSGVLYKDDVSIKNTSSYSLDMRDPIYYLSDNALDQVGNYWLVVKYKYNKAKPAIKAAFIIIKPDEHDLFNTDEYFFLQCIKVIHDGVRHVIDSISDCDCDDSSLHREYIYVYAGTEYTLPECKDEDLYRLIYADDTNTVHCVKPCDTTTTTSTTTTTTTTNNDNNYHNNYDYYHNYYYDYHNNYYNNNFSMSRLY